MTKAPKIPKEQRSFAGDKAEVSGGRTVRAVNPATGITSFTPG